MTRPFRHLCPDADVRDALTEGEFWELVYGADPADVGEPDVDVTLDTTGPCTVCGSATACGYDAEGEPMIHAKGWDNE